MNERVILVGTVSNVAKTIKRELKVVLNALSVFENTQVFLVESDSTDETVSQLQDIKNLNSNFSYVSMGKLANRFPNRIERIAYCRDIYVEFIQRNSTEFRWSYVAVADLDGMNFKLSKKGILSCFKTGIAWDGLMANQKYGYYDIYALRATDWVEKDCFNEISEAKKLRYFKPRKNSINNFFKKFSHFDQIRYDFIYKKMKILNKKSNFISINSGFGAFAIYKVKIFRDCSYLTENTHINESEHVKFHLRLTEKGLRFYINPMLINSNFNIYNINRFKIIRLIREIKKKISKN